MTTKFIYEIQKSFAEDHYSIGKIEVLSSYEVDTDKYANEFNTFEEAKDALVAWVQEDIKRLLRVQYEIALASNTNQDLVEFR